MDGATRRALIARYKDGYLAVTAALEGINDAELDARQAEDDWTAREVAHHLGDSEMTSSIRLRRLLTEDHPLIMNYDERSYARLLHYDRPISSSIEAFRAVRQSNATILERLADAEWTREGTHSESGRYSVETWLEIYARHAHDHAEQIWRARAAIPDRA